MVESKLFERILNEMKTYGKAHHDKEFANELQKAFSLGAEMVSNPWEN